MFDANDISAKNVCASDIRLECLQWGSKITLTPPDTKYIRKQKCYTL